MMGDYWASDFERREAEFDFDNCVWERPRRRRLGYHLLGWAITAACVVLLVLAMVVL